MTEIQVTINGKKVVGHEGVTILELARENGIDIPTLCYVPELPPVGACRICVVEVEGSKTLVGSCHTPITEGMVIQTHSPGVIQARRMIIELLLSSHAGNCFMCDKANICELRKVATELEVGLPRFSVKKRYYPIEDVSPYVKRDLSKCILCRRCVRACSEIKKEKTFSIAYRGFDSKVVYGLDQPLDRDACRDCDVCISICPTGALSKVRVIKEEKKGEPLVITD